jgi:hypothetical protein
MSNTFGYGRNFLNDTQLSNMSSSPVLDFFALLFISEVKKS